MTNDENAALARLREAMNAGEVRVHFGVAFGPSGSIPTATLYTRSGRDRWTPVKPFITPMEGGTRADLLDTLAGLCRPEADGFEVGRTFPAAKDDA